MRYAVVIERAEGNYSAYSPDGPGCVAGGATVDECKRSFREALALHLRAMLEDGLEPPIAECALDYVEVEPLGA